MRAYQGHRSWNAWNVSLWINNDEPTYLAAQQARQDSRNLWGAAAALIGQLPARTPDGAKYNMTSVMAAIRDIPNAAQ